MALECGREENCSQAAIIADAAVKRTFAILGVDIDKPEAVEEFRISLRFSHDLRRAKDKGLLAVAVLFFIGAASAMWAGIVYGIIGHK